MKNSKKTKKKRFNAPNLLFIKCAITNYNETSKNLLNWIHFCQFIIFFVKIWINFKLTVVSKLLKLWIFHIFKNMRNMKIHKLKKKMVHFEHFWPIYQQFCDFCYFTPSYLGLKLRQKKNIAVGSTLLSSSHPKRTLIVARQVCICIYFALDIYIVDWSWTGHMRAGPGQNQGRPGSQLGWATGRAGPGHWPGPARVTGPARPGPWPGPILALIRAGPARPGPSPNFRPVPPLVDERLPVRAPRSPDISGVH